MNKSKKIVREEQKGKKKKKKVHSIGKSDKLGIIGICAAVVCFIALAGLVFYDNLHKDPVLRVGEEKYYLADSEVMYYAYSQEASLEIMAQAYAPMFNMDVKTYWNQMKTNAKSNVMTGAITTLVMTKEAEKNKFTLTEEEKKEVVEEYSKYYDKMSNKRKKAIGMSKEEYVDAAVKEKLANKYVEKMKEDYKVTEASLDEKIDKSKYDERKVQVIYVPTTTKDSENKTVPVDDATKEKYKKQMESYLKDAKAGKDLEKMLDEKEKLYVYSEKNILMDDSDVDPVLVKGVKDLKDGEVGESVLAGENFYYIVKMVDSDSTEAYDEAVETAIDKKIDELYSKDFNELQKTYDVEILSKGWDDVEIGEVVLGPNGDISEFEPDPTEAPSATEAPTSEPK